jgi:hypothetical protein
VEYKVDFDDPECIRAAPKTTQIWIPVSATTANGEVVNSSDLIGAAVILTTITHLSKAFEWHKSGLKELEFTHDLTHGTTLEGGLLHSCDFLHFVILDHLCIGHQVGQAGMCDMQQQWHRFALFVMPPTMLDGASIGKTIKKLMQCMDAVGQTLFGIQKAPFTKGEMHRKYNCFQQFIASSPPPPLPGPMCHSIHYDGNNHRLQ